VWLRHRDARPAARLQALTVLTLFLTFDLVLFGAFTRLTDSGLGCPDWPGCYGSASPVGAYGEIHAAQSALPSGPVTQGKAWVEMTHRYVATGVGALIAALAVMSWIEARRRRSEDLSVSPWWATLTLGWVCLQGAFGALTVTMKLYPAIVTAHLLGGLGLLVLLALQSQSYMRTSLALSPGLYRASLLLALLTVLQVALGGWVSTNYAVLACQDFPTCQGHWWPTMDFDHGFTILRHLGAGKDGGFLPFAALTAIHYVHRLVAYVVLGALALFAWRLHASGDAPQRRWALGLSGVALWQLASGLGNVLLGWPLVAAVAHTAGAAALVTMLTILITQARHGRRLSLLRGFAGRSVQAAP
jgi:cytochrome c oxidase assembly protein subunit 15